MIGDHLPMVIPRLVGERVTLRSIEEADRASLRSILAEPGVARWWGTRSPDEAVADLFEPSQISFVIEVEGAVVGSLQVAEEDDPDYRCAGIDLFLATEYQGRGLGPEAIRLAARVRDGVDRSTRRPGATSRGLGPYLTGSRAVVPLRPLPPG